MSIIKDLSNLVEANIISQETADKISNYYQNRKGYSTNRLVVAFGILGAILVGLGIILIIAHNWDELSRVTKTFFAFFPLVVGQVLCGYVLLKKKDSTAWREGSTIFLFFMVGASISLVSQIYNIPGDLRSFMLTWILLSLPLVYVLNSSAASLLYLVGITYYAGIIGYWSYPVSESYLYWLLLAAAIPHYYLLYRKHPGSNFMTFHNWFFPLSVVIILGTIADGSEEFMFIAYTSLFGLFGLIGNSDFLKEQRLINNAYKIFGSLGTVIILLMLSFSWFWDELKETDLLLDSLFFSSEFIVSVIISMLAGIMLLFQYKEKPIREFNPVLFAFILFILIFVVGIFSSVAVIFINALVFAIGVITISNGAKQDNLANLNYGLLIITALIVCRFFDTDMSFVLRGILFVIVGAGFFTTNYYMLKKRS